MSETSDYIEAFRAAARARGIDPVVGSTSYQAALVRADLDAERRPGIDWLRYMPDEVGKNHSRVEAAACYAIEAEARRHVKPVGPASYEPLVGWETIGMRVLRELWREARHEATAAQLEALKEA